jgi:hypothetical protein
MQDLAFSEIHDYQAIAILFRKKSEHETRRSQDCAIDAVSNLPAKARILPSQFQKVDMQIVKVPMFFPLGKIELAADEYFRVIRHRQNSQCFLFAYRQERREPLGAAFPNGIAHRDIAYIGKKYERARRAELLALK